MSGDKKGMLIRRRPSVATFVAVLFTLVVGTQTGLAASSSQEDHNAPEAVESVDLVDTDSTSITISWPPSPDNDAVAYRIYVNGSQVGWQAPDRVPALEGRADPPVHDPRPEVRYRLHRRRRCR